MYEISVVIATFNGEKFIKEQLDSILRQTVPASEIIVTDDGSSDSTLNLVREYAESNDSIRVIKNDSGAHGVVNNFKFGLSQVAGRYIFLSDQDDVWFDRKIEKTLELLRAKEQGGKAVLIFTDQRVVNARLELISNSFFKFQGISPACAYSLARLLLQNPAAGCTMGFNRELLKVASPFPENIVMHDWWLMLVARLIGEVDYLNEPTSNYRQHSSNEVGAKSVTSRVLSNVAWGQSKRALTGNINQAEAVLSFINGNRNIVCQLDRDAEAVFKALAGWSRMSNLKKVNLILSGVVRKSGRARNLGLLASVLVGKDA